MSRQVVVELIGDPRRFSKTMDDAAKKTESFGSRVKSAAKVAAVAFAAVSVAAIAGGKVVFEQGAQFEAMDNKAKVVFGDSLALVQKWAAQSAAAMGLTKREATGLAAGMGDLLVPMGFTRDQAAKMSTDIVGLSGALSEWSGGTRSAAEVSEILQKALLGERDGLKALGISITDADVKARLAKNGTDKLTGAALEQAKALATQELLFEKSTDAQTAFTEGQAKGLRTGAELGAMFKEMSETLITALYPAVLTVMTFFKEQVPKIINTGRKVFERFKPVLDNIAANVLPALGAAFKVITEKVVPALGQVFNWVVKNVIPPLVSIAKALAKMFREVVVVAFNTVVKVVKQNWPTISSIVKQVAGAVKVAMGIVVQVIKIAAPIVTWLAKTIFPILGVAAGVLLRVIDVAFKAIGGVWNVASKVATTVVSTIGKAWSGLTGVFKTVWNGITGIVKGGANFLISIVNGIIGAINSIQVHIPRIGLDTPLGWIGVGPFDWWGLRLGRLPYLHAGGIVPGTPGSDVLTVLQAGERVVPRSQAASSGAPTIYVNIDSFIGTDRDIDRLAERVARRIVTAGA